MQKSNIYRFALIKAILTQSLHKKMEEKRIAKSFAEQMEEYPESLFTLRRRRTDLIYLIVAIFGLILSAATIAITFAS